MHLGSVCSVPLCIKINLLTCDIDDIPLDSDTVTACRG